MRVLEYQIVKPWQNENFTVEMDFEDRRTDNENET